MSCRRFIPSVLITVTLLIATAAPAATPSFSDQTTAAGITFSPNNFAPLHYYIAGGCVADFNNDGWQDIYVCGGGSLPDHLYINNADGTFSDQAAAWGIQLTHVGSGAAAGDFDGDGRIDLFVTSIGDPANLQPDQYKLFRNTPAGFVDVSVVGNINEVHAPTAAHYLNGWGGAWGDYDLDGDLDLAVAHWHQWNKLLRNEGDGVFSYQTIAAGIQSAPQGTINGFGARFVDMDGDRFPEILWIGDYRTGEYFVNNSNGTFSNATLTSGTMRSSSSDMGATVADFDRNGLFDFYITAIDRNQLYINQGNHVYSNRATAAGVLRTGWGWGAVSPDIDHDGWPDLITTGKQGQYAFLNNTDVAGVVEFSSVTTTLGIRGDGVDNGRGLANFDYDNDGDQDVLVFCHNGPLKLYRNDLTGDGDTHWLRVFLDTQAAADIAPNGIGSVVKVTTGGFTQMGRIDGGSNYLSQSEMSAHFGLATATVVDELRVEWTNGDVTILNNVPADQTITIAATSTPLLLGDMNCDAVVDIADAAPFALALTDAAAYAAAHPTCDIVAADLDGNNTIDGRDISLFVVELLN